MAPLFVRRSFRVRPALRHALIALGLAFVACTGPARADDPQPTTFGHSLAHGQAVIVDVTDDINADVHVTTWNRPSVDITVAPSGHYADAVRLSGGVENGSVAMHVICSPSPHRGAFGWLNFYRPEARIDLRVPATATLSVHAINGPITVDGVTGDLQVTLVNGPIVVTGAGTKLYLTTTNGPVEATVAKITGQPDITISTTNGPVDFFVPKGFKAKVHASTVFGPVENNLTNSGGPGNVSLETVNGPVTITPQ